MIHIQIKEGKLMPGGRILNGTEAWLPYENITHWKDGQFYRTYEGVRFRLNYFQDYVRIGKDRRIIGLSNVIVPKNHVITGKH